MRLVSNESAYVHIHLKTLKSSHHSHDLGNKSLSLLPLRQCVPIINSFNSEMGFHVDNHELANVDLPAYIG